MAETERDRLYIVQDHARVGRIMTWNSRELKYKDIHGGGLPPPIAVLAIHDVLCGLSYLHSISIIHRDIKPENLLMNENGTLQICDFGISVRSDSPMLSGSAGSLYFYAPEMCSEGQFDGRKADVWSAGVCFYAFLYRELPVSPRLNEHGNFNMAGFIEKVKEAKIEPPPEPALEQPYLELLLALTRKAPSERPTAAEALRMDFSSGVEKIRAVVAGDSE